VLLGLVERYNVFAIITTNYLDNIDPAFLRRMKYIVRFELPDAKQREQIWKKLIPPKMPLDSKVNLKKLAYNYSFSGGEIKNAIQRAATSAILNTKRQMVTMNHLINACEAIVNVRGTDKSQIGFKKQAG